MEWTKHVLFQVSRWCLSGGNKEIHSLTWDKEALSQDLNQEPLESKSASASNSAMLSV